MGLDITGVQVKTEPASYFASMLCPVHTATNTNLETATSADMKNLTKFSIGMWAKVTTQPSIITESTLWVNRNADTAQNWLRIFNSMRLRANVLQDTNNRLYTGTLSQVPLNTWFFCGFSFDGSQAVDLDKIKIFYNGAQQPTYIVSQIGTVTATQNTGSAIYRVGTYSMAGIYPFAGNTQLCAVLVGSNWTDEEWQTWYNAGRGADITNCTHKWLLNDNSDTIDDSVGTLDMTYSGAGKAWVNHF